jgi:hypothetical protein
MPRAHLCMGHLIGAGLNSLIFGRTGRVPGSKAQGKPTEPKAHFEAFSYSQNKAGNLKTYRAKLGKFIKPNSLFNELLRVRTVVMPVFGGLASHGRLAYACQPKSPRAEIGQIGQLGVEKLC